MYKFSTFLLRSYYTYTKLWVGKFPIKMADTNTQTHKLSCSVCPQVGLSLTDGFHRREGALLQQHEVAGFDVAVKDVVGVALSHCSQDCPHVTSNLQSPKEPCPGLSARWNVRHILQIVYSSRENGLEISSCI